MPRITSNTVVPTNGTYALSPKWFTETSPTDSSQTGKFADRALRLQDSSLTGQFTDKTVRQQDSSPTIQTQKRENVAQTFN